MEYALKSIYAADLQLILQAVEKVNACPDAKIATELKKSQLKLEKITKNDDTL